MSKINVHSAAKTTIVSPVSLWICTVATGHSDKQPTVIRELICESWFFGLRTLPMRSECTLNLLVNLDAVLTGEEYERYKWKLLRFVSWPKLIRTSEVSSPPRNVAVWNTWSYNLLSSTACRNWWWWWTMHWVSTAGIGLQYMHRGVHRIIHMCP